MTFRRRTLVRALAGAVPWASAAAADVPEPDDYRQQGFRAPTPKTLRGALVVDTAAAAALWRAGGAAFVDVLPRAPRPAGLPEGTIWRAKPRFDIPGSVWLPDTGYGGLAPATEAYFLRGLQAAGGGKPGRLLVVYCLADCWMSWNAAKRALAMGFSPVAWYRDGTDGWQAAGLKLERREPVAR